MKNKIKLFVLVVALFMLIPTVKASTLYTITNKCSIRTEPNEKGTPLVPGTFENAYEDAIWYLEFGDTITLVDNRKISSTSTKCSTDYYYVTYTGYTGKSGYVCGDFINFTSSGKYYDKLRNAGFPESYLLSLNLLQEKYPNWEFEAVPIKLKWNDVINNESSVGQSYIKANDPNGADAKFLSLDGGSYDPNKKTYLQQETGGWYAANKQTVAYYMDPRNWLNESGIYMFESNHSNTSYSTENLKSSVTSIFGNNKLKDYINHFVNSNIVGINPVFLAARSRQEVTDGSNVTSAASGVSGYYNFFNIGAYSSCINPIYCGNDFASDKGWTTAEKAISGGAHWIYTNYTVKNQQTIYFQKFNVNNQSNLYLHQYMMNIVAPKSEAAILYSGYSDETKQKKTTFYIPVYEEMPSTVSSLPTSVNQDNNNNGNTEEKNTLNVPEIVNGAGYSYNQQYMTKIEPSTSKESVVQRLAAISNQAQIVIDNNSKDVLGTGDTITLTNNGTTEKITIVVYGDTNGDGKISVSDLLQVQKHLLKVSTLNNANYKAGDVDKDGKISVSDLLKIQNTILKKDTINQ